MDYQEEQTNEIIVLNSIYGDEMTILSEEPYEFEIDVKYSDYEDRTENPPFLVIYCKYTEKYPDEVPIIAIDKKENLPESEVNQLKEYLINLAEKNIGTVMIYTLITAAQDWINDFEDNAKKQVALEKEKKAKIEADNERKKFEGTQVTKETFLKWKLNFDAERNISKTQEITEKSKKLTGRELFMKDISLNESDLKFLEEDGEMVKVNESLFQNIENLDIE